MKDTYYVVTYTGPFGFIKPWTAVRDGETFSQQFLTPSIVAGMERKLFPELLDKPFGHYAIAGHRLTYQMMTQQQEQVQPRGWTMKGTKNNRSWERPYAILMRNTLLYPTLYLAFNDAEYARRATEQHLCLCRNEDLIYPTEAGVQEVSADDFANDEEQFAGFELMFEQEHPQAFLVGYNRFDEAAPMYGWLRTVGDPVKLQ